MYWVCVLPYQTRRYRIGPRAAHSPAVFNCCSVRPEADRTARLRSSWPRRCVCVVFLFVKTSLIIDSVPFLLTPNVYRGLVPMFLFTDTIFSSSFFSVFSCLRKQILVSGCENVSCSLSVSLKIVNFIRSNVFLELVLVHKFLVMWTPILRQIHARKHVILMTRHYYLQTCNLYFNFVSVNFTLILFL